MLNNGHRLESFKQRSRLAELPDGTLRGDRFAVRIVVPGVEHDGHSRGAWTFANRQRYRNMRMKVAKEQFLMDGRTLIHQPTNAVFRKAHLDAEWLRQGTAGEPLPTGDYYDKEEIAEVAREILLTVRSTGATWSEPR
jgi:hypothetical protein